MPVDERFKRLEVARRSGDGVGGGVDIASEEADCAGFQQFNLLAQDGDLAPMMVQKFGLGWGQGTLLVSSRGGVALEPATTTVKPLRNEVTFEAIRALT